MSHNFDAKGYYAVLNVSFDAPVQQIKQQYYAQAKFWHPDHNEAPNALEVFQKISVAYDILKDEKSRLKYDLLSIIYKNEDFPDIQSLKVYKNQSGHDDSALRVLKQRRVLNGNIKETKDICNYFEAKKMVFATSLANWLLGWWGKGGVHKTLSALKFNLNAVYAQDADNLKLLLHNSLAYQQENHLDMAWIYAKQAQLLSPENARLQELLARYIDSLDYHPQKTVKLAKWSAAELRIRQKIIPYVICFFAVIGTLYCLGKAGIVNLPRTRSTSYYSEVQLGGASMADDQFEKRIVRVDGDISDSRYLYHLTQDCLIYYGPDERYDVLAQGKKDQTVRIVGHTANMAWFKIMIDNGENGYVNKRNLQKGVGAPIPPRSKIYR